MAEYLKVSYILFYGDKVELGLGNQAISVIFDEL